MEPTTPTRPRRTTQADIARYLSIGQNTVSRALRDGPNVRPETRRAVLEAARTLGYRVSNHARAMRGGRLGAVALLQGADSFSGNLPPQLLNAIHRALADRGVHLLVDKLPTLDALGQGLPGVLREWMVDGILVNHSNERRPAVMERLAREESPVVWVNFDRDHDCVRPDDERAAFEATGRLLALGHRRIAYAECGGTRFETVPSHYFAEARYTGYLKAMAEASLPPIAVNDGREIPPGERVAFFEARLAENPHPTAFLCLSSSTVHPLLYALCRRGLDVPGDVSVVSFENAPDALSGRAVGAMLLPQVQVGYRAAEMLLEKIDHPQRLCEAEVVPFEWFEGQTVAGLPDG